MAVARLVRPQPLQRCGREEPPGSRLGVLRLLPLHPHPRGTQGQSDASASPLLVYRVGGTAVHRTPRYPAGTEGVAPTEDATPPGWGYRCSRPGATIRAEI